MEKLNIKHILLLLLYTPTIHNNFNDPIRGRTRIIKMMFLFDKEIKKAFLKKSNIEEINFPDFSAWKYGPFCKDVYNDIEFFINNEFIDSSTINEQMEKFELEEYKKWLEEYLFDNEKELLLNIVNEEIFKLTEKGMEFVQENIYRNLSENQKIILIEFKHNINNTKLNAILRYTYLKYPKYTKKSNIREKIIG